MYIYIYPAYPHDCWLSMVKFHKSPVIAAAQNRAKPGHPWQTFSAWDHYVNFSAEARPRGSQ